MATIRRYRRSDAERSPEKKHRAAIAQVIAAPLVLVAVDNGEMAGVLRGGRRDGQQTMRKTLQHA